MSESPWVHTLIEGERELLSQGLAGNASSLRTLLSRYAPPIFSYLLFLSGCGRDKAYAETVSLIAKELLAPHPSGSEPFLVDCLRVAVQKARSLPVQPSFVGAAAEESAAAPALSRFLREALERLSFEDKALLLLRDQLCLPYAVVGAVHALSQQEARVRVERARLGLRESLEEILRNREGAS